MKGLNKKAAILKQKAVSLKDRAATLKQKVTGFKNKPPLLFTVGTAALLIVGGGIAYWGVSHTLSQPGKLPAGMKLVPQNALMTLSISTQESQWNKLRQFGTPETQATFDNFLLKRRDQLLTVNGYRFKQDIKPWIGEEVTLVFLPATDPSGPDLETDLALILPIADRARAKALMAEPKGTTRWVGRDYKGVQIQSMTTPAGDTFEIAVIGTDWIVLGKTGPAVEKIIDVSAGATSVLQTAGYRQAIPRIDHPQAFAHLYVNLPAAKQLIEPSQGLPLGNSEGLAATMTLSNTGVQFNGTSWLAASNDSNYANLKNAPDEMTRRLPEDALLMVSGTSLQKLWQSIDEADGAVPLLPFRPENLKAGLQNTTGLRLDEDLMPWMDGEFSFALLPPANPAQGTPDLGQLLLLVKASDRDAAEATWKRLDGIVESRHGYDVKTIGTEAQIVTQWVSPFGGIAMSHGWLDGNVTFLGVGAEVADAIAPRPPSSLAESTLFQTLTADAPKANTGHFFINLTALNAAQGMLPIPQLAPDSAAIPSAIEAIGATTAVHNDRTLDYSIQVELTKTERAAELPENPTSAEEGSELAE
ncbi:MAG: DUF3352 domain-containing protein [Cyanobacteria bacterium P01_A01_bin.114]